MVVENQPLDQTVPVKSKSFRTMLQVPLLLVAAAGMGFAGQQMWQNNGDVSKIFHNSQGEFQCPIAALFGCGSNSVTTCAGETGCTAAAGEACASAEGCTLGDDCCAAMLQAAEAAANEAPVSALTPANMDGVL